MRRIYLIVLIIVTSLTKISAQEISDFYRTGTSFEVSIGGHMIGEGAAEANIGVGARLGKGWGISVGVGYTGSNYPNVGKVNNFISAYIEGKYSFLDRKTSPYIGLRVKGQYMLAEGLGQLSVIEKEGYNDSRQLFLLPQIGLDIKMISIWLGFGPHFGWEVEHTDEEIRNPHGNASPEITPAKDYHRRYLIPCLAIGAVIRL